ncbi:MAG TPA: XRE family transcriptional regulator [Phycisphaerae bacterium]|nr:XRE family transcriptional regulator [Phycisphaerae bacterium]HPS53902.1 XRE family transcriptional regulator [Phycisphaerae bacterium]
MNFGDILRKRREELGLTQDALALLTGISKPYLSNIETGRAKNPPTDGVLSELEKHLQMAAGELTRLAHLARTPCDVLQEHETLSAENVKLKKMLSQLLKESPDQRAAQFQEVLGRDENFPAISAGIVVPVINRVAAGYPQAFTDLDYPVSVADEYVRCPDIRDQQAFATRVVGDSMEPKYHEGDIVVFSPNTQPRPGDDCFVRFGYDEGTTFKRFYQDSPESVRLQPLNSKYPSVTYPTESITGIWPAVFRIESLRR